MTRPVEPPPYQLWVREDMTAMQERFWSKVGSPTPSGCREWNAQRTAGGYGKFSIGGTSPAQRCWPRSAASAMTSARPSRRLAAGRPTVASQVFEEPFDNPEWEAELAAIRERAAGEATSDRANLLRALDAEMHDSAMWARHIAEMYDEVSGGAVSYPNTLPSEVIRLYGERLDRYADEAAAEAREQALAEAVAAVEALPGLSDAGKRYVLGALAALRERKP